VAAYATNGVIKLRMQHGLPAAESNDADAQLGQPGAMP
jgi:hypothetical protein